MDRKRLCFTCVLFLYFGISCVALNLTTKTTTNRPQNYRPLPDIASLCPFNRYCKSPPLKNIPNTKFMTCCQPCYCDAGCYEVGNCCPDSPYTYAGSLEYPCKHLAGATGEAYFDIDSSLWYNVIDNCKDKLKALIHPRCSKPTELEDLVVVFNKNNGRVYKNKHCALCNGEHNYTDWVLKVICKDAFIYSFKTVEERNRHVFENRDKCPVYSVSPDDTSGEESRCFPESHIRSVCNITGLWDFYDKDIEEACVQNRNNQIFSVDEELISIVTVKYSNVYCYLCKPPRNKEKKDLCLPDKHESGRNSGFLSFSALIDLRHNEEAVQESPCKTNEIWDQFSRVCRQVLCPAGTIPLYGSCDGVVSHSNGYPIQLKFELDYDSQMVQIRSEELMTRLAGKVVQKLGSRCGISTTSLTRTMNSSILFFELIIYSTDTCSIETMLTNIRILAISKELRLKYRNENKESHIILKLNFDTSKYLNLREVLAYKSFFITKHNREIDSTILNYCPSVALTQQELNSFKIRNRLNTTSIKADLENGTLTQFKSICIDEYFRIRQELSGTVSNHQFIFFVFEIVFTLFCFI